MGQKSRWIDRIFSHIFILDHAQDERFINGKKYSVKYIPDSFEPVLLPLPRVLLGASGVLMTIFGIRLANLGGLIISTFGLGALVRSVTNLGTVQLVALTLHPTFEIKRTVEINAP